MLSDASTCHTRVVPTAGDLRERARAALLDEIRAVATRQLAEVGPAALSLRAVARDLGLASSAVYRYVPSRDALLTLLITAAYDDLGAVAERASATAGTAGERWLAVCRAVRAWARVDPHRWALVYGSPVPGYVAPADTVGPAVRLTRVLVDVVRDALDAGDLRVPDRPLPGPRLLTAAALELAGGPPPAPHEDLLERALTLVTGLVGVVSYELFGHLVGAVTDVDAWCDRHAAVLAEAVGLHVPLAPDDGA